MATVRRLSKTTVEFHAGAVFQNVKAEFNWRGRPLSGLAPAAGSRDTSLRTRFASRRIVTTSRVFVLEASDKLDIGIKGAVYLDTAPSVLLSHSITENLAIG